MNAPIRGLAPLSPCGRGVGERGTDTRDPDEKLSDAQRALACLESLLMKHPDDDLTLIHPANLAGFLRLVLAQFPE